jgi:signal peptidase II
VPNDAASGAQERGRARSRLAIGIVVGVLLADQLTKLWAVRTLADAQVVIVGDTVDFRLARNTGSAFSLFGAFTPVLAILAVAVAFFLVRALRRARDTATVVALALLLGGALGNLLDRVFRSPGFLRGAVIDFVHVGWWPTFNVADASITVGAILLVVQVVRGDLARSREEVSAPEGRE